MYRQGDLLFIKHDGSPKGIEMKEKIILCSSMTGHSHRISRGIVFDNRNNSDRDRASFYVSIPEGGARLLHEEHTTIDLPEGVYAVRRQMEVTGYVED